MNKAYDRIEWQYLENIMRAMGFKDKWIQLVMMCVTTVRYQIVLDDNLLGHIIPSRGLRQGDTLSPYLFILCAEGIFALMTQNERSGAIHGCRVAAGAPILTHLFFANNCFLFCRASLNEARVVRSILLMRNRPVNK